MLGKIALVTGATGGIGSEIARQLCTHGVGLILTGRDAHKLQQLKEDLAKTMPAAHIVTVAADLTLEQDCQAILQSIESHYRRIDMLICAHGAVNFSPFVESNLSILHKHLQVNLVSTIALTQLLLQAKVIHQSITYISSSIAQAGFPQLWGYSASKGALESFVRSLAVEIAGHGICVNAVAPGPTQTMMWNRALENQPELSNAIGSKVLPRLLSGNFAHPTDIAALVITIANTHGAINGQIITADSGYAIS